MNKCTKQLGQYIISGQNLKNTYVSVTTGHTHSLAELGTPNLYYLQFIAMIALIFLLLYFRKKKKQSV